MLTTANWQQYLEGGFILTSSGTSGAPKSIYQTPKKLVAANRIAIEAQRITPDSRVLTVCRMTHAGGALAQTLPALSIGAHVDIVPFNAFSFLHNVAGYTHTHLTPAHCELLMQTRSFPKAELTGLFVTCGSNRVSFEIIKAFVERGAVFMCNWGMTEIGPVTINTVFDSLNKVAEYRAQAITGASLLGDRYYCETRVEDGVLFVRGECCVYNDWFCTGDKVVVNEQNMMYYLGRTSSDQKAVT